MLEWMKAILGEGYTQEMDAKVAAQLGERYVDKADLSGVKAELAAARSALRERDSQLEALKKATGDTEALTQKIARLQEQNAQKDKDYAARLRAVKTDHAVNRALAEAKAINPATVMPLLAAFLEKAQLEEDGSITGLSQEIEKLRAGENTAFLFAPKDAAPKLSGATPAGGSGGIPEHPKQAQYAAQLAKAREDGDTLSAIHIKRAAAQQGIYIN